MDKTFFMQKNPDGFETASATCHYKAIWASLKNISLAGEFFFAIMVQEVMP